MSCAVCGSAVMTEHLIFDGRNHPSFALDSCPPCCLPPLLVEVRFAAFFAPTFFQISCSRPRAADDRQGCLPLRSSPPHPAVFWSSGSLPPRPWRSGVQIPIYFSQGQFALALALVCAPRISYRSSSFRRAVVVMLAGGRWLVVVGGTECERGARKKGCRGPVG